jgi:hypothetical protein
MTFTVQESRVRTIRPSDPDFLIRDGLILAPRASLELCASCPREYRLIIAKCLDAGWLKPVASLYDYEQTFDNLADVTV